MMLYECRLGLVWTECFDFRRTEPGVFSDRLDYEERVSKALRASETWQLPFFSAPGCPRYPQEGFWEAYLETEPLSCLKSRTAWKHLMPLRPGNLGNLTSVEAEQTGSETHGSLEGFCFPGGVGVVVNIRIQAETDPSATVKLLRQIRWGRFLHRAPGLKQDDSEEHHVEKLVRDTLDRLWRLNGLKRPARQIPQDRTLVTVIDAIGTDPNRPVEEDSDLHRALEALCTWRANWETAPLSSIAEARLVLAYQWDYAGHLHYAVGSGRAVWFPQHFRENQERRRITNLGRYHRNLTVATLQTDYMIGLIDKAADEIHQRRPLYNSAGDTSEMARLAAGALGRLYKSRGSVTYHTSSVKNQIEARRHSLDQVREFFGMSGVH